MTAPEEALRLYARGVVRDMCLALADHVDLMENPRDEDYVALADGRDFLQVTEMSADPYLDHLVDVLQDLVNDVNGLLDMLAMPAPIVEKRVNTHITRAGTIIKLLGGPT